jgi:hypothetical protein
MYRVDKNEEKFSAANDERIGPTFALSVKRFGEVSADMVKLSTLIALRKPTCRFMIGWH